MGTGHEVRPVPTTASLHAIVGTTREESQLEEAKAGPTS
jgi:hypothetical protein